MPVPSHVLLAQVQTLYRQSGTTFLGTLLAASVATLVLLPDVGIAGSWLWGWLATVVVLTATRHHFVKRFLRQTSLDAQRASAAARGFALGSCLSGCLWGVLGMAAFDAQALVPTLFVAFLLGGMVSGALGSLSVYYPAFVAYSVPSVLPFSLRCMAEGTPELIGFGVLTLVFMLVSLGYGRGLNRSLRASIELRFENTQLLKELATERDRAQQSNADKTALLAHATHDLRQPAYAAGLYAASLNGVLDTAFAAPGGPAPAQARHMAAQLEASVTAFNALLEGLLDLAQLDAQTTTLVTEPIDIGELLHQAASTLAATAAQRGVRLRVRTRLDSSDTRGVWVLAPRDALMRIVLNLTSNAIKFTTGSDVLLFARVVGKRVRVGVADTGPGIALVDQSRLFEAFVRLPGNHAQPGLGLGLAIVKRLAEQINAPVQLRSRPGRGSLFYTDVPAHLMQSQPATSASVPPAAPGALARRQTLVLDDDPLARSATVHILSGLGLQVTPLASAAEALAWLQNVPDVAIDLLLVTDLHLDSLGQADGRDGLYVLDAFRQRLPNLKALVITGETAPSQLQRIASSGVRVVRKPSQPHALEAALRSLG
jgi:signal transduction histidine kinase/CheY-like chemotaxis protein